MYLRAHLRGKAAGKPNDKPNDKPNNKLKNKRPASLHRRGVFRSEARDSVQHVPQFSTPSCLLMTYCCAMDKMLLVTQYSTSPAGKK